MEGGVAVQVTGVGLCKKIGVEQRVFLCKEAITSKIKHAIKLKTSPASHAQLLQPLLAFCWTSWTVRRHWLQAKTKC